MNGRTLRRRRPGESALDWCHALERELAAIGVEPGQSFVVAPPAATNANVAIGGKSLGPFAKTSDTSRKAAIAAYPRSGTQRWRVMDCIARAPSTREEIAQRLAMSDNTVRPRVWELVGAGFVEETGETRRTPLGCDAAVLQLTPYGRKCYMEAESPKAVLSPGQSAVSLF